MDTVKNTKNEVVYTNILTRLKEKGFDLSELKITKQI